MTYFRNLDRRPVRNLKYNFRSNFTVWYCLPNAHLDQRTGLIEVFPAFLLGQFKPARDGATLCLFDGLEEFIGRRPTCIKPSYGRRNLRRSK